MRRSKAILEAMPYLLLEDDELEDLDSKICHRLNQINDETFDIEAATKMMEEDLKDDKRERGHD